MECLLVKTLLALFAFSVHVVKGSAVSACTSGFMDMDVLMKRAERITNNNVKSRELDRELRVVPDWNFNCSGNITSLLLGVDIRTGETKYPEVQTWRRNGNQFTRVDSRTIVLSPGNFSASGVFQYHLTTPLPVVAGDMIGVYQPNEGSSVVCIYYKRNDPDAPDSYRVRGMKSSTTFHDSTPDALQEYILLSVITDTPQCSGNFLAFEAFKQKVLEANIYNVVRRKRELRIFPNINFTCSGNLTKWIVAGEASDTLGAKLQVWRRSNMGQNSYTLVGSSVLPVSSNSFVGVYNYTPSTPLEFQEGDMLGVYQYSGSNRVQVYYQETTGPANYRYPSDLSMTPPLGIETLTGPSLVTEEYDYPLVTVEIDSHQSVTTTEVVVHVMVVEKTTSTYFKQLQSDSYTSVHVFTTVSTSLAYTNVPTIVMSTSLLYINVPTSTIVSTLVSYTSVLPIVSTLQAHTSASTAVSTSVSYSSVPRPTTVVTNSTLLLHTTTMRRDSAISTSSLTVAQQIETGIIVIAAPVALVVIIIIIIIMIVTLIIIFTWWRRRSHKNTHSVQYPAVTTSDEIVKLQQNACYMTTNNEKDKQQDYEIANYKQIAIQPNTSYVTYNNKDSKLHVHNCIPDEHEYAVPSVVSTSDISHSNTTDDPISLQQNVSYITTTPNKPDNESEADHDDRSNVYTYAAVGPRYKLNPVAPAMVQNLAYGTSSFCSS